MRGKSGCPDARIYLVKHCLRFSTPLPLLQGARTAEGEKGMISASCSCLSSIMDHADIGGRLLGALYNQYISCVLVDTPSAGIFFSSLALSL
jgi:hypothetical protein